MIISALIQPRITSKDRKLSAPVFGILRSDEDYAQAEDHRLSRTAEIENIPEVVEEEAAGPISPRHSPQRKFQNTRQSSQRSDDIDDLPPPPPSPPPLTSPSPPPPPPPFEDDLDEPRSPLPDHFLNDEGRPYQLEEDDHGIHVEFAGANTNGDVINNGYVDLSVKSGHPAFVTGSGASAVNGLPPPLDEAPTVPVKRGRQVVSGSFSHEDSMQDVDAAELSFRKDFNLSGGMTPGDISDMGEALRTPSKSGRAISEGSILSAQDREDEQNRKSRRPTDTAYYIAKELLMTERTYKKDLEVLCVWFRNDVSGDPAILNSMNEILFRYFDPIYNFHYSFLKEMEQRLAAWEGKIQPQLNGDSQKIGDLLLKVVNNSQELYENYFKHLDEILSEIDSKVKKQRPFEEICRGFESQKVCYLPLNTFFLRPGQRLSHFKLILERLVKHYPFTHNDTEDCKEALCRITDITNEFRDKFRKMENLEKLMELQRDLLGLENLVHVDREFIREGCLQKFSRKGYQQRMFFLFSDMLVYTSRTSASLLQFKVHGQLPLRGMTVEETDQTKSAVQNSFAIYAGNKYILVAASSQEEKDKWIEDINEAVIRVKSIGPDKLQYPSLKSSASSSENVGSGDNVDAETQEKPIQHRANTTMHVCWHRNTSVSFRDHDRALKNQLSGYLLRKFKTSNGWQKLWVVFTNFCLFFYKTYQDDFPLASLPLLGYAVNVPEEEDGINKDHVFKLQFKNHVYFFRAESEYTFSRWMEVINSATHNARRIRLFSRLDSRLESS
ncbi:FERM, ARHGEF and pleckstrin domain-containing protein 2 [Bulinus truncatus]|nr:FERM, ARHGEF and pleckstrin domain-containing protein 2 [Bulinus truncatus]